MKIRLVANWKPTLGCWSSWRTGLKPVLPDIQLENFNQRQVSVRWRVTRMSTDEFWAPSRVQITWHLFLQSNWIKIVKTQPIWMIFSAANLIGVFIGDNHHLWIFYWNVPTRERRTRTRAEEQERDQTSVFVIGRASEKSTCLLSEKNGRTRWKRETKWS